MIAHPLSMLTLSHRLMVPLGMMLMLVFVGGIPCLGQSDANQAGANTSIGEEGSGVIIIKAPDQVPDPILIYSANASANVMVGPQRSEQSVELAVKVIQGRAERLSFQLNGKGEVTGISGEGLLSWSIRQAGDQRFVDLHPKEDVESLSVVIKITTSYERLPVTVDLAHLAPGGSIGFDSRLKIQYASGVEGRIVNAKGFAPLVTNDRENHFQTATGGQLTLALTRHGASARPIELTNTTMTGNVHPDGKSIRFQFRGTAQVSQADAKIEILSGGAAVSEVPTDKGYRLKLSSVKQRPVYQLVFEQTGTFPVTLDFVAAVTSAGANWRGVDFTVAAGAVVPLTIEGLDSGLEFHREQDSVVPQREGDAWLGFLPASGRARLRWKMARQAGEGKLFFSTSGRIETKVGVGLLRQDHELEFQVLQGELKSIEMDLRGPGEILDVQGNNVVAWKVSTQDEQRRLSVTLSQPITAKSQLKVRSQTPLGAFPIRVEGLRLDPINAIRHSGYVRLSNLGSVRIEPTDLVGLTQLAPEQFPGNKVKARQVFVYRFPATNHSFTLAADRIQPEVNVSQLVLYQLAETDRVIKADIELDIREAPIREWDFHVPTDYSVVSVTGAGIADYITASQADGERRNLKVIFGQDVSGRQLVTLHLEKNEAATEQDWVLPRIEFPEAKTVRGDIGIIGAPGFRVVVGETKLLVEKPLSYFPKPTANLQQAFRIREPLWSATMKIEPLDRSIQSDVFHLYSLSEGTVYGSALINYFVTGAPVSEWRIVVPESLGNVIIDGRDVRTWRREGDILVVSLHQPVMGPYTLLVTFEEKPNDDDGSFQAGRIAPVDVQGERGYIQVVSPMQVEINTLSVNQEILKLDPLELPAEFRLLSTAPPLGTWQYTERPFNLQLKVNWFQPGTTVTQVIEFSEANSRVSQDSELVTDVLYYVKSRGQRTLKIKLPGAPVRLWEVSVNGQPVTARQTDEATLIPLPGGTDPNIPVQVNLRLGKPTVDELNASLVLPTVFAPVLKTQWNIVGDEKRVLVPSGGDISPSVPVLRPSGFDWVTKRGIIPLVVIAFFTCLGTLGCRKTGLLRITGLIGLGIAVWAAISTASLAFHETGAPAPLQLSLPVLSAGETVEVEVRNMPLWLVNLSWNGLAVFVAGLAAIGCSFLTGSKRMGTALRFGGIFLFALGILMQGDGAPWFFGLLTLGILGLLVVPSARDLGHAFLKKVRQFREERAAKKESGENSEAKPGAVTALLAVAIGLASSFASPALAVIPEGFQAADAIKQQWRVTHDDLRLLATGSLSVTGQPGDRFLLLKAPAVLTSFEGEGLRLTKRELPGQGLTYIVSIPSKEEQPPTDEGAAPNPETPQTSAKQYQATFEFRLEAIRPLQGIPVLSGAAAVQEVDLQYDEAGWDVVSNAAVRIEPETTDSEVTRAKVLLGPGQASLLLKPQARDVTTEETQFFVEASNLYLPGPGVVDGRHRLRLRLSQGQLNELNVVVPQGLTVSSVSGPVGSWQFNAENGRLQLAIEPPQSKAFEVMIDTQRGLDPLPADVILSPLKVAQADGQVGLVAIAFGPDAQPEKSEPKTMSAVNLGDFDASLLPKNKAVLHRVYRYGAEGGEVALRVTPVDSEVRVVSKQVLSLGDERVVLGVNFIADISRAGLFQLSFPLPDGLEVESLTGASLHHWAELSEGDQRQIILHLNGKTLGPQNFSLVLSGPAPTEVGDWKIPRFELKDADRQTGSLVVRPTTGIRLRTMARQNVSETDPRDMGGEAQGALAFRLLQRDWNLVLGIEKLDPWVTGQVLHEITLREGQTRSALIANFNVQNASIGSLQISLPITNEDEIKTLRANGKIVSDFIRTAPDSDLWEVQFKRRVVGRIQFQIEYERRGDRENENEFLRPASFPLARQLSYYFGVRAGGRLEIEHDPFPPGWQRVDWNTIPSTLREAENRHVPALALRAVAPNRSLPIRARRHSLAEALKLRVAAGSLTTVLSPTGDQLTAVDVTMEVIQRSSLSVGLPEGGELFNVFVNGESVHSIRQGGGANAWQFYILPGIDDRTAKVRFVYSVTGSQLDRLKLSSPLLNVPLENIQWNVIAPQGFELTDHDGNLELTSQANQENYDRRSYLSKMSGKRQDQAQQAAQLLEQANQLLQAGEQTKARWALNSVANRYALDAASNEDARVQLKNLQTQQAIVGLNTRRQRLYLDNNADDMISSDDEQLRQAAAANPILQQDQLNFRPQQLSQLLRGNTTADNAILQQIANRLVQHQRTTEPAPQAIIINLPEEGTVYAFSRSVQVAESTPLELDLQFDWQLRLRLWQTILVFVLLLAFAAALVTSTTKTVAV